MTLMKPTSYQKEISGERGWCSTSSSVWLVLQMRYNETASKFHCSYASKSWACQPPFKPTKQQWSNKWSMLSYTIHGTFDFVLHLWDLGQKAIPWENKKGYSRVGGTLACQVLFHGKVNFFTTLQCFLIGLDIRSDSWFVYLFVYFVFCFFVFCHTSSSTWSIHPTSPPLVTYLQEVLKEIILSYSITYHQNAVLCYDIYTS